MSSPGEIAHHVDDFIEMTVDIEDCPLAELLLTEISDVHNFTKKTIISQPYASTSNSNSKTPHGLMIDLRAHYLRLASVLLHSTKLTVALYHSESLHFIA